MSKLTPDILTVISNYLGRKDYIICTLVCKSWHVTFARSLFYNVKFASEHKFRQFMAQKEHLKRLTRSIRISNHGLVELGDDLTQACPNIEELDLIEFNCSNDNEEPNIIAHINNTTWKDSLKKITARSKIIVGLDHAVFSRLTHITTSIEFVKEVKQILLPNLHVLDLNANVFLENESVINCSDIEAIRDSCPQLQRLYIRNANYEREANFQRGLVQPFKTLRSFYLTCTDGVPRVFQDVISYFDNLLELSCVSTPVALSQTLEAYDIVPYDEILIRCPNLQKLRMNYPLGGFATDHDTNNQKNRTQEMIEFLQKMNTLNILELDIPSQEEYNEEDITEGEEDMTTIYKEMVHLDQIINAAPGVKDLTLTGFSHVVTVDGKDEYAIGYTEDRHQATSGINFGDQPRFEVLREQGKVLCKLFSRKLKKDIDSTCKDEIPKLIRPRNRWDITQKALPSDGYALSSESSRQAVCKLEKLCLYEATLRNPTFVWLSNHCPKLKVLHILETKPYPWCEMNLRGLKQLESLYMSFSATEHEDYSASVGVPLIVIVDETGGSKTFKATKDETFELCDADIDENTFKIIIQVSSSLKKLVVESIPVIF